MSENSIIPAKISPVAFNPYKHHIGFLKIKITQWQKNKWSDTEKEIRFIGNNLIDLYFGKLTVCDIYLEIIRFARENNITSPEKLTGWLNTQEYKKIKLSDSSVWIIRQGKDPTHYLHIHPAKHSPFTIRVRAPVLKTVVTLQVFNIAVEETDLNIVNRIRTEKLSLSPIRALHPGKGIAWLIANFNLLTHRK